MEHKHIIVIRYSLFCGMTTKMEKKSERGVKGTKINVFPQKSTGVLNPLSLPLFLFWLELCEVSHVDKIFKKLEKQSEMKLRDVKV